MSKAKSNHKMGNEPELKGLLKHRFGEMELEPDIDLWPAIEEKIHEKPRLWQSWKPYTAIAACLVVLISVWIFSKNRKALNTPAPIAGQHQQVDEPVIQQDDYKKEIASLERQRLTVSEGETNKTSSSQKIERMQVYSPGPRAGQSLTLPRIEEQIIAAKTLADASSLVGKQRQIESMRAEKVEQTELASIKATEVKLEPVKVKPLQVSNESSIVKMGENTTEINLNNLNKLNSQSLKKAVAIAATKISEKTEKMDLPVKVEEKETRFGKKKTYQVNFFNVSFTRTTYRPDKTTKQL